MPENSNSRSGPSLPPPSYATYAPQAPRPASEEDTTKAAGASKNESMLKGDPKTVTKNESTPSKKPEGSVELPPPSYATYASRAPSARPEGSTELPPPSFAAYTPRALSTKPASSVELPPPTFAAYTPSASKANERRQLSTIEEGEPSTLARATSGEAAAIKSEKELVRRSNRHALPASLGVSSPAVIKSVKELVRRSNRPATLASRSVSSPAEEGVPQRKARAQSARTRPKEPERAQQERAHRSAGVQPKDIPSASLRTKVSATPQAEYSIYSEDDFRKNQGSSKDSEAQPAPKTIKSLTTKIGPSVKALVKKSVASQNQPKPQTQDPRFVKPSSPKDKGPDKPSNTAKQAVPAKQRSDRSPRNELVVKARSLKLAEIAEVEDEKPEPRRKTYYDEDEDPSQLSIQKSPGKGQVVKYKGKEKESKQESQVQGIISKYKGEKSMVPNQKGQMVSVPRYQPLRKGQLNEAVIRALCKVCNTDESEIGAFCGQNVICWDVYKEEYFLDPLWEYLGIPRAKWAPLYEKMERFREEEEERTLDKGSSSRELFEDLIRIRAIADEARALATPPPAAAYYGPDPYMWGRRLHFAPPCGFCAWEEYYWW